MAFNYENDGVQNKYIYLPKIGSSATYAIKDIRKITNDPDSKFNFLINEQILLPDGKTFATVQKNLGFRFEVELEDGRIITIGGGQISAFKQIFQKHRIQPGYTITVNHPEKGKWETIVLSGQSQA